MFRQIIMNRNSFGQKKRGVEYGGELIKSCIKLNIENSDIHKTKYYDLACEGNIIRNLKSIYNANDMIKGKRINIGGDHSSSIGTGAYTLNNYNRPKFIWLDAHADINDYKNSSTKNYHGMPLNYLTGLSKLNNIDFIKQKLKFENLLYIGIRDVDDYEKKIIKKHKINVITIDDMKNKKEESLNKINKFVENSPLHLSFDVDVLDPSFIKCTGTPVKGGLDLESVISIINEKKDNIVNLDICEFNGEIGSKVERIISLENLNNIIKKIL